MSTFKDAITPRVPMVFSLAATSHWRDAIRWLLYTFFGGLLPFWGTALLLLFLRRGQPFQDYFQNAELAVFCAGVLSAAIPVMQRRMKEAPVEHPASLNFIALLCIGVALLLFASVTITRQITAGAPAIEILDLNRPAILFVSLVLFGVSILLGFFVELTNNVRVTREDLQVFEEKRETKLAEAFGEALNAQGLAAQPVPAPEPPPAPPPGPEAPQ
jgi:TRAP-type C4-dicarboxylate transport system permease small subunit